MDGILFGVLAIEHPPVDAFIFWSAGHADSPYGTTWGPGVLYIYPPPLAQLLGVLPWAIFVVLCQLQSPCPACPGNERQGKHRQL